MLGGELLSALNSDNVILDAGFALKFNGLIVKYSAEADKDTTSELYRMINIIETEDIPKICKESFSWKVARATELKDFFKKLSRLNEPRYYEFFNNDYIREKIRIEYMGYYVSVNYGRVGGSDAYDHVIRFLSHLLNFFNQSILLKDLAYLPRLETKSCFLFDPIFRQRVREVNRANPMIKKTFFQAKFNIKEFVYLSIDRFFPNVGWRWAGGGHQAHEATLVMINALFEYGIWEIEDINILVTNLYAISEIMFNLENYLHNDRNVVSNASYFNEMIESCTKCRELVASCFLHIILMFLDDDVNEKLFLFDSKLSFGNPAEYKSSKFNQEKLSSIYKHSNFSKEKLYTYFSYILVTYLSRYKLIKENFKPIGSPELSEILSVLFNYISDINGDFFKLSLKMMKPEYFQFYYLKAENRFQASVCAIVESFDSIINSIKIGVYSDIENKYSSFVGELGKKFDLILNFLKSSAKEPEGPDEITTKKLVLSLYNMPHYVISLLRFMIELNRDDPATKSMATAVFHKGLNVLRKIGAGNSPGFNQMFTSYNYGHMDYLMKMKVNDVNSVVMKLILANDKILTIEYNPKIMKLNLDRYKDLLDSFVTTLNKVDEKWDLNDMSAKIMLALYNYNSIFNTLLETVIAKGSRYELYLSNMLEPLMKPLLKAFAEVVIDSENEREYDFWNGFVGSESNFASKIIEWDELPNLKKRIVVLELLRSFLQLFNRSSSRFYTHKILLSIKALIHDTYKLPVFFKFFNIEVGVNVMNQITRLYTNFMIFSQNHLLNNRFEEFGNLETQTTEITLSETMLEEKLMNDLMGLKDSSLNYLKRFGFNRAMEKFYLCAFLPLLFKYFNGLLNIYIYEDHKIHKKNFELAMKKLLSYRQFVRNLNKRFTKGDINKDASSTKFKHLSVIESQLDEYVEMFEKESASHLYDEAPGTSLYNLRKHGYKFLKEILLLYRWEPRKKAHLEKYLRYDPHNSRDTVNTVMAKKLRFNYLYRTTSNLAAENEYNKTTLVKAKEPKDIIKALSKSYERNKTCFFEDPESNQCFKVLKTADILKNNLEYYINYFFKEMNKMDVTFEDLDCNILTNPNYISVLLMMDNLIKISDGYRDTFYSYLSKYTLQTPEGREAVAVIEKIWKLHKMLYYFVLYKTFLDRDWAEVYTLYYLVSNFLQNLCENNHIQFKIWFHENTEITDGGKSLFLSYFSMFEAAFQNSNLHKNKCQQLVLSDKPELFHILNRLTVGMTEFINGGAVRTQFQIYTYKIDIWVGIILRIIDNVDSQFYVLKENILAYILGLTEGYDKDIINFMATNFPITRLYDLIYHLTKKIYIRQYLMKRNIKLEDEPSSLGCYKYIITEEDEKYMKIDETDALMDYYKKYDTTFSDHIILGVVIKAYTLMRDLSSHVVRYENFLLEKNEDIKQYIVKKKPTEENLEPLYIWNFLKHIIVDIEIAYKDANAMAGKKTKLRLFYFKKLPQCFFLTDEAKKDFRDRVNINSLEEKHEQFFNEIDQYDIATKDLKGLYIYSKTLFRFSTEKSFYIAQLILYLIAIVINICLLLFYDPKSGDFSNFRGNLTALRTSLSLLSALMAFIFGAFWFGVKYPTLRKINWEKYDMTHKDDQKVSLYFFLRVNLYESIVKVGVIQTFILHFLFSLMGLYINAFFYTVLLLLIIHLSLLVYNVVLSFMNNYDKLFFTLIIILVVINSFSYLASQFYRSEFRDDQIGSDNIEVCNTYFSCLMNSFNIGIRGGGGLGDFIKFHSNGEALSYIGRLFFDVFFFIMINIILLGIFFGIIVDSFKELRNAMTKRNRDEDNVCFTCGLERYMLERKGIDFDEHLETHNMWNYFFYVVYLRWKPENDYDGVDIYVHNHIIKDFNTGWLPIGRTLRLDEAE